VVGIFPGVDSYIRLVSAYLIEYGEDWLTGISYIPSSLIEEQRTTVQNRYLIERYRGVKPVVGQLGIHKNFKRGNEG